MDQSLNCIAICSNENNVKDILMHPLNMKYVHISPTAKGKIFISQTRVLSFRTLSQLGREAKINKIISRHSIHLTVYLFIPLRCWNDKS